MKTIYIPKGETIRYESLATEHLVVHGCLQVTCGITAKTITGYGTVHAGTVNADVIRVDDMDAGSIVCKRLLAKRVQSPEVFASESAAVSCFLSSAYVETGKLTVTLSEIDTVNAAEIINLTPKKRTLFGTLLASAFRSIWTVLTVPGQKELKATADVDDNVREAVVEPVQEEKQESVAAQAAPCATEDIAEPEPADEELNRIVGIFKLAREQGYTLKLIPGTPEENAPVFDFEHERILHNAAYYPIAQARAWLSGHDKVEPSDLLALKDYLWRLPADREKVESVLNRFCINPMQEKVNDVREMALDSQAGFEEACGDGSRADLARKAFIKLRGELVRLYQKQCELRTSAQSDSETALMDGLLNDLEDISRRAHEKTGFTYTPLSEIAALN